MCYTHDDQKTAPTSDVNTFPRTWKSKTVSQYSSMQDSTLIGPTDVSLGKCLITLSPSAQTWISLEVAGIFYGQVEAKVAEMQL